MAIRARDLGLALLVTTYGTLGVYGEKIAQSITGLSGDSSEIAAHDTWAIIVLLFFVLSSIHARFVVDRAGSREQMITFLGSLTLIVGIAVTTGRLITLYYAFVVYALMLLPLLLLKDVQDEAASNEKQLFSFFAYAVVMAFAAGCLGLILQGIAMLALGDMRGFGLVPSGIALLLYQIMIANATHITSLSAPYLGNDSRRWKLMCYGIAVVLNAVYGLFWLSHSISFQFFGRFLSAWLSGDATIPVAITTAVVAASFSAALFSVVEIARESAVRAKTGLLVDSSPSPADIMRFLAVGAALGTLLAMLALSGLPYASDVERPQVIKQLHLIWIDAILTVLVLQALVLGENARKFFLKT